MPQANTQQSVLIIEDEAINIQALAETLRSRYQIKIATSAEQATKIIESHPPDLILLDIVLPDLNGYELCRKLKKDHKTKNIPVIFVTAKNEVADEAYGLSLGAVDYITKPFHMPIVLARIENHLNLKRKSDLLERLAAVDGLTDVFNRRRFDEELDQEIKRSRREAVPLSLVLIDVDFFKDYNDTYGHAQGDQCLRDVAKTLLRSVNRPADLVARIGGEEFAVILPRTELEGALVIADHIRANVEACNLPHANSRVSDHVTVSAGVASLHPPEDTTPEKLLDAADRRLYDAKHGGRNRVCPASHLS